MATTINAFQRNAFQKNAFQVVVPTVGYPSPSDVRLGVKYGPTGTEYTGTLQVKTGQVWLRRR